MNTLSAGFVDSLASILGSPPAYTLTPSRPPPLNLRKDARSAAPAVSDPSNPPLHVTQYAPAYGLQLLLRVHGVHHLVLNTDYRRCQNNSAAYPLLTDIQDGVNYYFPSSIVGGGGGGSYAKEVELSASDNDPPHLPPTPLGEPLAHIVKFYIPSLLEEIPDSSVALYTSLLTSILSPLLLSLSFADNGIGYESTRALHSTPLPSFLPEPFLTFLSLVNSVKDNLTLWAEKVSVVRSLPFPGQFSSSSVPTRCRNGVSFLSASSSIHLDVPAALIQASNAYRILSDHLSSNPSTTSSPHFFNSPTFFDPLLFEHLYSAIVNPHLVKILRSQPLLLSYFTTMVETYFFEAERTNERQTNDEANEDNPRDRLRQAYNFAKKAANSSSFSAQADSAANAIKMEQNHVVKKNRSLLNFHRLRFGGAMVTDKGSASPPPPLPLSEPLQAQKNALENDNIKWFTGVGVAVGMYLVWGRVQVRIKAQSGLLGLTPPASISAKDQKLKRTGFSSAQTQLPLIFPSDEHDISVPPHPPPSVISPTKNPFRKKASFSLQPTSANNTAHSKRYILLESLSTLQTLLLLLLPYISLMICAFLDSSPTFFKETVHFSPPLSPGLDWLPNDGFTFQREIKSIPQLSSFLTADVSYVNLTEPVLNKVAKKRIHFRASLIQDGNEIYATKEGPLTIVCAQNPSESYTCNSPRILDVLFSAPGSNVLKSDTASFKISYIPQDRDAETTQAAKSILVSASYDIQKENRSYAVVLSTIRTSLFICAVLFTIFFVNMIPGDSSSNDWWLSPYVLVPERRYALLLLISLICLLNPVVVVMQYDTDAGGSVYWHACADFVVGIGIYFMLAAMLCLMQGLRYHTKAAVKLRSKQQRDLRKAQQAYFHVIQTSGNHNVALAYTRSLEMLPQNGLALKHDPNSPFFERFVGPKISLVALSTLSLLLVVLLRYPILSLNETFANSLYLTTSLSQTFILALWIYFICKAALKTGRILKKQPFIDTRYTQLSYRILANILLLGVIVVVAPAVYDLRTLGTKWLGKGGGSFERETKFVDDTTSLKPSLSTLVFGEKHSIFDNLVRAITAETSHLPFVATATSFGPGKLIYITMCCLVVGVIFFPPKKLGEKDGSGDKRSIIMLANMTHTWRIFPLAIKVEKKKRNKVQPYTPVFCNEIACLLLECSWQAYYSAKDYSTDVFAPGKMNLESLGLKLLREIIDEASDTHCYVCVNIAGRQLFEGDESESIVVLFRGTVTKENLKTDMKTDQVRVGDTWWIEKRGGAYGSVEEGGGFYEDGFIKVKGGNTFFEDEGGRVHNGFWECYRKVRTRLISIVVEEVRRVMGPKGEGNPPKIFVTGHSLGGALAQLFSFDLACNITVDISVVKAEKGCGIVGLGKRALKRGRRNSLGGGGIGGERVTCQLPVALYTYGSPRVGNNKWASSHHSKVPHHFRVYVEGDLFVGLPRWSLGSRGIYRHVGTECILDENETGTIAVAPTIAEKAFRFSRGLTSLGNHNLVKYRTCLEAAFGEEELGAYYEGYAEGNHKHQLPSWLLSGQK